MANREQPPVLIDMDGVLADFDTHVQNHLTRHHPHITLVADRQNFRIAQDYPEHYQTVRDISDQPGFFESLPLIDYAQEGWQRVIDLGYHPQICSSPITTNEYSSAEKLRWLGRHLVPVFGQQVVEEAIITKEKYRYDGIALIDDRPELDQADQASWQHIIFDQPYNRHTSQPRLYGWLDLRLAELLDNAQQAHQRAMFNSA